MGQFCTMLPTNVRCKIGFGSRLRELLQAFLFAFVLNPGQERIEECFGRCLCLSGQPPFGYDHVLLPELARRSVQPRRPEASHYGLAAMVGAPSTAVRQSVPPIAPCRCVHGALAAA